MYETLEVICLWLKEKGYPPTRRELGAELGIGMSGVYQRLKELQAQGYIEIERGLARGIRVLRRQ